MAAGARATLVTLWPIQDEHAPKFMETFYESLRRTQSKPEALREAQLAMLRDRDTAHPSLWAPYCLFARAPFDPVALPRPRPTLQYTALVLCLLAGAVLVVLRWKRSRRQARPRAEPRL
jgi:hypothetical protein